MGGMVKFAKKWGWCDSKWGGVSSFWWQIKCWGGYQNFGSGLPNNFGGRLEKKLGW